MLRFGLGFKVEFRVLVLGLIPSFEMSRIEAGLDWGDFLLQLSWV